MRSSTPRADRRRWRWRLVASASLTAAVGASSAASAAPGAEALFEEGKRLMAQGRVAEGCRSFEQSFALDPLGGTLMALAICHEKEGKLATALREYERARGIAQAAGRDDRVEHALRSIASLEPRVPRLIVDVPPSSRVASLDIQLDGVQLAPDEWNTALPIDPGPHRLAWSAPGHPTGQATVEAREGQRAQVSVTFDDGPAAGPGPTTAPAGDDGGGLPPTRIAAFATGGVGVAALGIGTVLGILALGDLSDSDAACDTGDPPRCTPAGLAAYESGTDLALAADVTLITGLVLVGTSIVLFVLPVPPAGEGASTRDVKLQVGPGRASLSVRAF